MLKLEVFRVCEVNFWGIAIIVLFKNTFFALFFEISHDAFAKFHHARILWVVVMLK